MVILQVVKIHIFFSFSLIFLYKYAIVYKGWEIYKVKRLRLKKQEVKKVMKSRSKKLVALFATVAMTASLLAGCGGGNR